MTKYSPAYGIMDGSRLSSADGVGHFHRKLFFKNAAVNIMHCIVWLTEDIIMNRASGTGFRLSWLKAVFRRQTLHSCVICHGKMQTQTVFGFFFVPLDYRV